MVQFSSGCVAGGTGRAGQHPTEGAAAVTQQRLHNSSTTTRQFETIYLHHYRQFCASGMRTQHCYSQEREHKAPRAAAARAETRPQPPTPPDPCSLTCRCFRKSSAICTFCSLWNRIRPFSRGCKKGGGCRAAWWGCSARAALHCTPRMLPATRRAPCTQSTLCSFLILELNEVVAT